jgi:diguanylate cyclase (GGDEF)-like protein
MPQAGSSTPSQASAEDSFLDLMVETLESLDPSPRGLFLRHFFRTVAQLELSDAQSLELWGQMLSQRHEAEQASGKRSSLKTAMLDVLVSNTQIRVPILMEYEEFRKLRINAATDALTGLYNRRLFEEYFERELNRVRRYGQQLSVVILDLHRLKEVNDGHGHLKGDQMLQLAASTLRKTLRASDSAFRIGGDEFALLLPETDPEQAATLCRRVRSLYESETAPLQLGVPVTLDYGVAVHPQDGDERDALLRLADERLYQLKQSGRETARVIPIEPAHRKEPGAVERPAAQPVAPAEEAPRPRSERRKWERVSLAGTKASAVLQEIAEKTASVLDLSYGGVALLVERPEELPNQFYATLHVPILPPVRVSLQKTYALAAEGGRSRVGCAFVS